MGKWKRRRKEKIKEGENKNNENLSLRLHSFQPHATETTFFQVSMINVPNDVRACPLCVRYRNLYGEHFWRHSAL